MSTTWVRQEHANGCGVATLAMLLGTTYDVVLAVLAEAPEHSRNRDWDKGGCSHYELDWVLAKSGAYVQRRYRSWDWTPEPFAPLHYASVNQPSNSTHFVVMLADGGVLDPLREGVHTLSDWPSWNHITGVVLP